MKAASTTEQPVEPPSHTETSRNAVLQMAEQRLKGTSYLALRLLSLEFHEGMLILHGRVPTFYQKQVAQTVVIGIPGIHQVVNRTTVETDRP